MTPTPLPPPVAETFFVGPVYETEVVAVPLPPGSLPPPRPNGPPRPTAEELAEDWRLTLEWLKKNPRPPQ